MTDNPYPVISAAAEWRAARSGCLNLDSLTKPQREAAYIRLAKAQIALQEAVDTYFKTRT